MRTALFTPFLSLLSFGCEGSTFVPVSVLAKPQFVGLSFFVPFTVPSLVRSNLRVIGRFIY